MTANDATPKTRRAVIVGALTGLMASIATAIGRPLPTEAAAGNALILGSSTNNAGTSNTILTTSSSVVAFQLLQNGPGTALMGYATAASGTTRGVYGRTDAPNGYGVQARNAGAEGTGAAVQAIGVNNHGLDATTTNHYMTAVRGTNNANAGTAIRGNAQGGIGVFGGGGYNGVRGESLGGVAVSGHTDSGWAGHFEGPVKVTRFIELDEVVNLPTNTGANVARLFVRDNGSGKTQLVLMFAGGTYLILATQP